MKKTFFIVYLLGYIVTVSCQNPNTVISGKVSGDVLKANSNIKFFVRYDDHNLLGRTFVPDTVITCPIETNGTFNFKFTSPSKLFCVAMEVYSGEEVINMREFASYQPYLFKQADSVFLNIRILNSGASRIINNKASFTGRGSDKLNCQYLLYHFVEPTEVRGPYYFTGPFDITQPYDSKEKVALLHQKYRETIVEQYSREIDDAIISKIAQDIRAESKYLFVSNLLHSYIMGPAKGHKAIIDYYKNEEKNSVLLSEDDHLISARAYPDFILAKEKLHYRIKHQLNWRSTNKLDTAHYFDWMYNNLISKYSGLLRDRLITTWFLTTSDRYFSYQDSVLGETIRLMSYDQSKEVLKKHIKKSSGSQTYPFVFIDTGGKEHRLEDYKDKILVLDFWFTGCKGCTEIPAVMKIIMEQFKNRDDIAFLSVSTDASAKTWKNQGLKSGLYSHPEQIHLKTIGSSRTDPFILNYEVNSYPRIMLIGKHGRILSISPRDPRLDNGKDIINLIQKEINHP
ncbi:TlpA family protein disulfide reductase [Sinomicrobium sp. M5D2P17]